MTENKEFLVISGQPGSGKDAAADYLARTNDLWHVSAGDVIRNEAANQGFTEVTRETLAKIKDELDKISEAPIVTTALEQYEHQKPTFPGGLVISGLRRIKEVQCAKDNGAQVIFIEAPDEVRYKRIAERMRSDDVELEDHIKREKIEAEGLTEEGKEGIWLNGVEAMADIHLNNDGSLQEFEQALDQIIQSRQT